MIRWIPLIRGQREARPTHYEMKGIDVGVFYIFARIQSLTCFLVYCPVRAAFET